MLHGPAGSHQLTNCSRSGIPQQAGGAAGDESRRTIFPYWRNSVTGYPYVQATAAANPADVGGLAFLWVCVVDNQKLADLNAFLFGLRALPAQRRTRRPSRAVRRRFRAGTCVNCHNLIRPSLSDVHLPMKRSSRRCAVPLAQRTAPLNPILNTVGFHL